MGMLIAVAGLAGAGKTTAIDHLESLGAGRRVYVGELVLNEVRAQGLEVNPENENSVRLNLRRTHGAEAFAALAVPVVLDILSSGENALLDAIFSIEEHHHFRQQCSNPVVLLGIVASFDLRANRLRRRSHRTLSRDQLKIRDETDQTKLGLDRALAEAQHKIVNERSLEAFKEELERFWGSLSV
jgi:dephospho-CoA kinase